LLTLAGRKLPIKEKMKKIISLLSLTALLLILVQSCYYDKEDDLYPFTKTTCDTTNVSYSLSIAPIMAANCNSCHTATNANGGVITDTWDGLNNVAKEGKNSKLWNAVNWTYGGSKNMPSGGSKLPDCDLSKVNTWINAGAPNN
jgi:hypothetical protein